MLWTLRSSRLWSPSCRPFASTRYPSLGRTFSDNAGRRPPDFGAKPTFRAELGRSKPLPSFTDAVRKVPIRTQVVVTILGTVGAFGTAAHLTNYDLLKWWGYLRATPHGTFDGSRPPTSEELQRVQYFAFGRRLQTTLGALKTNLEHIPETLRSMITYSYVQICQPILNATDGKRMCWAIGAVNCAVFVAWRFPRLQQTMMRSFAHNPLSGRSYTLFTSMFSHEGLFHLAFNLFALASFGAAASQYLLLRTKEVERTRGELSEPTVKWQLLALFVSAGLFSGLVSHIAHGRIQYPRLIRQLRAAAAEAKPKSITPGAPATATTEATALASAVSEGHKGTFSLGSSGAIYALVMVTALGFPDAEITLVIPPWFPINIQTGVFSLVAIDILGALRGWRIMDHYAHLGGALFGWLYFHYGASVWYWLRDIDLPVAYYLHGNLLHSRSPQVKQ